MDQHNQNDKKDIDEIVSFVCKKEFAPDKLNNYLNYWLQFLFMQYNEQDYIYNFKHLLSDEIVIVWEFTKFYDFPEVHYLITNYGRMLVLNPNRVNRGLTITYKNYNKRLSYDSQVELRKKSTELNHHVDSHNIMYNLLTKLSESVDNDITQQTQQVETEQVKTEQVKTEQVKIEQVKTEQVKRMDTSESQSGSQSGSQFGSQSGSQSGSGSHDDELVELFPDLTNDKSKIIVTAEKNEVNDEPIETVSAGVDEDIYSNENSEDFSTKESYKLSDNTSNNIVSDMDMGTYFTDKQRIERIESEPIIKTVTENEPRDSTKIDSDSKVLSNESNESNDSDGSIFENPSDIKKTIIIDKPKMLKREQSSGKVGSFIDLFNQKSQKVEEEKKKEKQLKNKNVKTV
ncbi:MAG: hypothetical protein Terrestrivirus5_43 [Terrestrivirus sp.]|uniref:Uncharacterized protein n=1 Tax=Terrestrivirus sp. TaxID=2487775 RepID=A0A3G4ZQF3_9VIRU|nr:MAG: hypothetical protein Terrestrivirus5_43 [Terrestrivirus sp.]